MVTSNYDRAASDLNLFANNMDKSAAHFRIQGKGDHQILKKNGMVRYHLSRNKGHSEKIQSYINERREQLEKGGSFTTEAGGYSQQYIAVQKFNKVKSRQIEVIDSRLEKKDISDKKKAKLEAKKTYLEGFRAVEREDYPALKPAAITLRPKLEPIEGLKNDRPEKHKERKFSFGRPFSKKTIQVYPTDKIPGTEKQIPHGAEAGRIGKATQKERWKNLKGQAKGAIGFNTDSYKKYKYNIYNEPKESYSMKDDALAPFSAEKAKFSGDGRIVSSPKSYWFGHATQMFSLPGTTIVTDLVEGGLFPILYPRQTEAAAAAEDLPVADIYLLSHNHVDHYDKKAIKKLLAHQPVMVVPEGDGHWYRELGFENVSELNWWDRQEVVFNENQPDEYTVTITATPARHWSGQGPCGGHDSTFLGYVIESTRMDGSILFGGDTARLNKDHMGKLRTHFPDLKTISMPGGPDGGIGSGKREDLESTHQSSVDALWVHMELFMKGYLERNPGATLGEFREAMAEKATVFMHTMTYKLGNLHLSDTKDSVLKVLNALDAHDDIENILGDEITKQKGELSNAKKWLEDDSLGFFKKRQTAKTVKKLNRSIEQMEARRGPSFDKFSEEKLAVERFEKHADTIIDGVKGAIADLEEEKSGIASQIRDSKGEDKEALKQRSNQISSEKKEMERLIDQMEARKGPLFELYLDRYLGMKSYEWLVYKELGKFCDKQTFANDEKLSRHAMSQLLRETVTVPKIGSRFDFDKPKAEQADKVYDEFLPAAKKAHQDVAHRTNDLSTKKVIQKKEKTPPQAHKPQPPKSTSVKKENPRGSALPKKPVDPEEQNRIKEERKQRIEEERQRKANERWEQEQAKKQPRHVEIELEDE